MAANAHASHRCPDCGRPASTCYTMPCLGLEIALAAGKRAIVAWFEACGYTVTTEGKSIYLSEREVQK